MIDRYNTSVMKEIWSDENKYKTWLKVEIAVTEVLCEMGLVPKKSFTLKNFAKPSTIKSKAPDAISFGFSLWSFKSL